jgi:antitoxin ParD1/3/4
MPSKSALNVSLTPELTAPITAKIRTGHDRSANEVVPAALRFLDERDRRAGQEHQAKSPSGGHHAP